MDLTSDEHHPYLSRESIKKQVPNTVKSYANADAEGVLYVWGSVPLRKGKSAFKLLFFREHNYSD